MIKNATQKFVPIDDVKDGVVILKGGSMRGILMASSINFSLKSDEEREAILLQFQDFLNSLDFSVQIVIQSRKLDIRPYVALLEQQYKKQANDLMRIQIEQYIAFVKSFTESTSIMTKSFFVVIPYDVAIIKTGNSVLPFGQKKETEQTKTKAKETFDEQRLQLDQRMSVVEQGLTRCGIRVARLGTEETVELFYKIFNPGESEKPIKVE